MPFFAYMAHYAVHAPFETDSRFAGHYPDLTDKPLAFTTLVEGRDKSLGDLIGENDNLVAAKPAEALAMAKRMIAALKSENVQFPVNNTTHVPSSPTSHGFKTP